MIFDTHAHYDDPRFDEDREVLLLSMKDRGIGHIINVGADMEGSRRSIALAKQYPFMYCAVGVHPEAAGSFGPGELEELRSMAQEEHVVAIGEIGLDYAFFDGMSDEEIAADKAKQKECFEKQLALARELHMPVFIHSRDAAEDTMCIMKAHTAKAQAEGGFQGGIIHCYAYSPEMALQYVDMGYVLGIGGVLTFKNARKLPEVVQAVPLGAIVLETDAPYLAPVPHRGERNDSSLLPLVAERIAELKETEVTNVIHTTEHNAFRVIGVQ